MERRLLPWVQHGCSNVFPSTHPGRCWPLAVCQALGEVYGSRGLSGQVTWSPVGTCCPVSPVTSNFSLSEPLAALDLLGGALALFQARVTFPGLRPSKVRARPGRRAAAPGLMGPGPWGTNVRLRL